MIHIVLYEPEIPQNTGNIMRTCSATGATLHLIEPLGFILDMAQVRRSAMDYKDNLEVIRHDDYEEFIKQLPKDAHIFFLSRYGKKSYSEYDYKSLKGDIYLVFGKESSGIPKEILKENLDTTFRIPMVPSARSLNLSNTVAITIYEVLRQLEFPNMSAQEVLKGADFIER